MSQGYVFCVKCKHRLFEIYITGTGLETVCSGCGNTGKIDLSDIFFMVKKQKELEGSEKPKKKDKKIIN